MEAREGLMIPSPLELDPLLRRWRATNPFDAVAAQPFAVSPQGTELCWSAGSGKNDQKIPPFLIVDSQEGGVQPVWLDGQRANGALGISSGGKVIVVKVVARAGRNNWALLALDLRAGTRVHDLSPFLTEFEVPNIEDISVSGSGTLVALGTQTKVQVLQITTGSSVLTESGWIPKLSPDGQRLAFISRERLHIRSLADGTITEPLAGTRVMGAGGWSPNGRYLLAGAWTRSLALEKRQIVVDTVTGDYGVLGKLHEGDYGSHAAWISAKFMAA
jgi:hypothetical protein